VRPPTPEIKTEIEKAMPSLHDKKIALPRSRTVRGTYKKLDVKLPFLLFAQKV
jgi:hypothetical protein